jgi:hypothetical protein
MCWFDALMPRRCRARAHTKLCGAKSISALLISGATATHFLTGEPAPS